MSELYDILTETPPTKVVLLALDQGLWDCERSLAELSALCEANHMEAVAQITQKRQTPETGIVLGSGKLEEASLAAQTLGAECAVFDGELTGSQIRNISNALGGLEVIDRTMLILEIFRSRAVTNEGKLQTELALLRYRLPRLQGMGEALSRQGGGGGGGGGARRGAGETKLELDRRHVHARIDALAEKLTEMEKRRGESRKARAKTGMPVVSLVGYTNVGKSSLMNALCGPSVAEADMLFATLDPTSRKLVLPSGMAVLLVLVLSQGRLGSTTVADFGENAKSAAVLQKGDVLLQVDGKPCRTVYALSDLFDGTEKTHTMKVLRGGKVVTLPAVTVSPTLDENGRVQYATDFRVAAQPLSVHSTLAMAGELFRYYSGAILGGFWQLFTGKAGMEDLSGPIGTVSAVSQAVRYGWRDVLSLMALLTINVGIFNLLPIPALDGCKLLFLAWEGLTGHPVPLRAQSFINTAGMVALLWLMILVTMQDITRFL